MDWVTLFAGHRSDGHFNVRGVVHPRELPRRRVWRMRTQITEVGEPPTLLAPKPVEKSRGEKATERELGGTVRLAARGRLPAVGHVVAPGAQMLYPAGLALGQVQADRESWEDPVVTVESRVVDTFGDGGIDALIGVAEKRRVVPGSARDVGDVVESRGQRSAVRHDPIVHLVRAGVDRRASRRARCGLGKVTRESYPFSGDAVQRGSAHERMAGGRIRIAAELIERDEEDVHLAASTQRCMCSARSSMISSAIGTIVGSRKNP